MSLDKEEISAIVTYRVEKSRKTKTYTLRLTGDYNDHYDLDEQDVLPLIEPAERLILDASKAAIENIEQR